MQLLFSLEENLKKHKDHNNDSNSNHVSLVRQHCGFASGIKKKWHSITGLKVFHYFIGKEHILGTSLAGPVVKTLYSTAGDMGSIPGQGAKVPHASRSKKKNKV